MLACVSKSGSNTSQVPTLTAARSSAIASNAEMQVGSVKRRRVYSKKAMVEISPAFSIFLRLMESCFINFMYACIHYNMRRTARFRFGAGVGDRSRQGWLSFVSKKKPHSYYDNGDYSDCCTYDNRRSCCLLGRQVVRS